MTDRYEWKKDEQIEINADNNLIEQNIEDEEPQEIEDVQDNKVIFKKREQVKRNMPEDIRSLLGRQKLLLNGKYRYFDSKGRAYDATRTTPSSKYMQPILDRLKDIEDQLLKKCNPDNTMLIHRAFVDACTACENYLDNRNPWTAEGKARKQIVRDLYAQIKKESLAFEASLNEIKERKDAADSNKTWLDVLKEDRTEKYNNGEDGVKIRKGGAAASEIYIIEKNGKRQFFKENEKVFKGDYKTLLGESLERAKNSKTRTDMLNQFNSLVEAFCNDKTNVISSKDDAGKNVQEKMTPEGLIAGMQPEALYKFAMESSDNNVFTDAYVRYSKLDDDEKRAMAKLGTAIGQKNDEDIKKYQKEIADIEKAMKESDYMFFQEELKHINKKLFALRFATRSAHINKDDELSKRNVATSRMAKLLGLNHIIAKSRMAKVTIDGKIMTGITMEEAEGSSISGVYKMQKKAGPIVTYSPDGFRDILSLQIFDLICGQVDRHLGNYNAISEIGPEVVYVTAIKGIDNDMSFGEMKYSDIKKTGTRGFRWIRNIEVDGKLTIPYIDRGLAMRIKAITPEIIDFTMADILSKPERKALMDRITGVKKVIDRQLAYEEKMRRTNQNYKSRIIKSIEGDNTAWENALNDYKKKTKADFERNPEKTRKNVQSSSYFFVEYLVPQKNADED